MNVVILGLSITSSWGNGHATGFRGLVRELSRRGDEVLFLERDVPWYAQHRDLPEPPWGRTRLYGSLEQLDEHRAAVRGADLVMLGSFVPEGVEVARWMLEHAGGASAFYDIDTPVTIGKLRSGEREYLAAEAIPGFDLYLSFTGGPALVILAEEFGARRPVFFPCFVDPEAYAPPDAARVWSVNYLGTYAAARQPALEEMLFSLARRRPGERFSVAGPMYPQDIAWPENVEHIEHLAPAEHPRYYASARLTLNLTRPEMKELGRWSRERFGFGEDQLALRQMQVYELARLEESFDIVLFMGVLYHLRYPLLALDIIATKVRERLILQTLTMPGEEVLEAPEDLPIDARAAMLKPGWPVMAFIEHSLAGDPTNWWAPNQACTEAMLRSIGLEPRERPGHEIVIAHRTGSPRIPDELRAILAADH